MSIVGDEQRAPERRSSAEFRDKGSQMRVSPALFNRRDDIRRFLDHAKRFA